MASVYDLKPKFQNLLRPLVSRLSSAGVTANQVTIGAAALSAVVGFVTAVVLKISDGHATTILLTYPVVLFARMALNAVDGMLARDFGQKSQLGAYLNELCDIVSDAALYLPFSFLNGISPSFVVSAVILAGLSETAGILGSHHGPGRRYDGPMGKSDRAVIFGLLSLLLGFNVISVFVANLILVLVVGLLCWTVRNRVAAGLCSSGLPRADSVKEQPDV